MDTHEPVIRSGALVPERARRWSGVEAGLFAAAAHAVEAPPSPDLRLSLHVGPPVVAHCRAEGIVQDRLQSQGDIDLLPAGASGVWEDEGPARFLLLRLTPALLATAAEGLGLASGRLEIAPRLQLRDPRIEHVGWALKAELEAGTESDPLYADSLGLALAAHLLRRYGTPTPEPVIGQALSRRQLGRVLEMVEARLDQRLTLAELAAAAGLSPSHFKPLFKASTGLAPHQYVIRRRVERARVLLLDGRLPMAQVALDAGFAHQSHMARAMRRVLGVTPGMVRRDRH
jgi:AraC family transcriptional regulator